MPSTSKDEQTLVPPCKCHKLNPGDWPWKNGTISIYLCMETCPYCGQIFPSCFDLQEHLLSDRYRKRHLIVSDNIKARVSRKASLENKSPKIRSITDSRANEVIDLTGSPPPPQKRRHINRSPVPKPSKGEIAMGTPASRIETSKVSLSETARVSQEDVLLQLPPPNIPKLKPKHSPTPAPEEKTKVQLLLDCLQKFDPSTHRILKDINLSTPDEASPETKNMWTESTATWPQIFESRFCWKSHPPSGVDLIIHTCNSIAVRKEAEAKGDVDDYEFYVPAFSKSLHDESLDPLTAIAQLSHPDITKPVALLGYRLPDLVPDGSLVCPEALTQFVEPFKEENLQILLTPEFWFTDLHIDNTDSLATTVGPTEKIWLAFPPTTKNLEHMREADAQRSKLARIGKVLEGGLIYKTTSAEAIYVPVGCIHAVFTVHGGFLLSIEFNTPKAAKVLSALFLSDFHIRKDQYALAELPGQFIEAVALALRENQVLLGIESWIKLREYIVQWADTSEDRSEAMRNKFWVERRPDWKKKASKTWNEFFSSPHSQKVICPCGGMKVGESFKEHFRAEHMFMNFKLLGGTEESKKGKRKRKISS